MVNGWLMVKQIWETMDVKCQGSKVELSGFDPS